MLCGWCEPTRLRLLCRLHACMREERERVACCCPSVGFDSMADGAKRSGRSAMREKSADDDGALLPSRSESISIMADAQPTRRAPLADARLPTRRAPPAGADGAEQRAQAASQALVDSLMVDVGKLMDQVAMRNAEVERAGAEVEEYRHANWKMEQELQKMRRHMAGPHTWCTATPCTFPSVHC